jgi:N-acetylglucosamine-6-phosphate deacetylase
MAENTGRKVDDGGGIPNPFVFDLPGLVDLQVNGYRGVDFISANLTEESCVQACREMLDTGATAFLPTLVTSPPDIYRRNLPVLANVVRSDEFQGRLPGIHLEGPFISPVEGVRGAHCAEWIREPDVGYLEELIRLADGTIRLLTIAADRPGAEELSRCAVGHGIAVSLGHHMADEADLDRLTYAGARGLTHLGNGVPALLDRHPNPIWAGLANDDLSATIIADGHHLPASVLTTIIRTKGVERCIVISDAAPAAGLLPGEYEWMGSRVRLEENGRLYDPATGYLAGSSATLLDCANHLLSLGLVGVNELAMMCFYNPLRLLGIRPNEVRTEKRVVVDMEQYRVSLE